MLARKGTVKQMTSYFKTPGSNLHGQEKVAFESAKEMIDRCTSELLEQADMEKNMEFVNMLKEEPSGKVVTQVAFLLRKKLGLGSKYIRSISYTISLVECMVAHGGVRLQAVIGTNFFLMEMARITKKYASKPQEEYQEVAQHLLELIQAWGEIFGSLGDKNKMPYFVKTYYELRQDPTLVFPAQPNLARGPALTANGHSVEDEAFIADMHNQSQQLSAPGGAGGPVPGVPPVGAPANPSISPQRVDPILANTASMYGMPVPQISPSGQQPMMNNSPPLQHGFSSAYNVNQAAGYMPPNPAFFPQQQPFRQPGQQFSFEEAFEVAAQQSLVTIDQKTIDENKRILNEIANSRAKQFQSYNAGDYALTSSRRESFEVSVTQDIPFAKPAPKPAEPVMTPSELKSTVKESLVILIEMIVSTNSVTEIQSNEIAAEFSEKVKQLQPKFSEVIDKALAENASDVEVLFTLNENVMQTLWIYEKLSSGSLSISEAKAKIRPIQSSVSGSQSQSSNSYSTSYSATTSAKTTANAFTNEYSDYNPAAAASTMYSPATTTSYSGYQPSSYANVNVNSTTANNSYSNAYSGSSIQGTPASYSDPFAATSQSDRRLSSGSAASASYYKLPAVPTGAPEQLYRAESFYRAPASTVIPPTASAGPAAPSKIQYSSQQTTANYSNVASNYTGAGSSYSGAASTYSGAVPMPQTQPRNSFSLPVYRDPFNGASISQPSSSRITSRSNSRSNSRSGTPERMRDFATSNALIEGMLSNDPYESSNGYEERYSYTTATAGNSGKGYYGSDGSPTNAFSSSTTQVTYSTYGGANGGDPTLTRIPASKLNQSSYGGSSTMYMSNSSKSMSSINASSTSTAAVSNNPFDSFC